MPNYLNGRQPTRPKQGEVAREKKSNETNTIQLLTIYFALLKKKKKGTIEKSTINCIFIKKKKNFLVTLDANVVACLGMAHSDLQVSQVQAVGLAAWQQHYSLDLLQW